MGKIADVLVDVVTATGSRVALSTDVDHVHVENGRAAGVVVTNAGGRNKGKKRLVRARKSVICNANVWTLPALLRPTAEQLTTEQRAFFLHESAGATPTKSFMHLHLGLDATGLDRSVWQPHYTVMDQGLHSADPCADRNMVAVSNPSVLDNSLVTTGPDGAPSTSHIMVHAYGAGNEPYAPWRENNAPADYAARKEV